MKITFTFQVCFISKYLSKETSGLFQEYGRVICTTKSRKHICFTIRRNKLPPIIEFDNKSGPNCCRTKFDYEFHPAVLHRTLNQNKLKVIEPLYKQRIINKTQWDLLFPVSGKGILLISKINMKTNTETSRHKPMHFKFKAIKRNTFFSQTSHFIRNSCNLCISAVNLFLSFNTY